MGFRKRIEVLKLVQKHEQNSISEKKNLDKSKKRGQAPKKNKKETKTVLKDGI